jgi:hypothetical protein
MYNQAKTWQKVQWNANPGIFRKAKARATARASQSHKLISHK